MSTFPSTTSADGIWTLTDQRTALMGSNWPSQTYSIDYLVVAGGGGGGAGMGGGGGAGGFLTGTASFSMITYTVTVGAGGRSEEHTSELQSH